MPTDIEEIPEEALENIAYLARSDNRVLVLTALAKGPHTRRELAETTGCSRATLGRIVNEFEERDWAERTADGDYVATPAGTHVVTAFRPLIRTMETIRSLGDAVGQIPTAELDIDLHHFGDATVRQPAANEPLDPGRPLADLLRDATRFETLTFLAPPMAVGNAMYDGVTDGRLTTVHVFAGGLIEYLHDNPDGPPPWYDYLQGGAQVYRYDGHIPCNLFVVDDRTFIVNDRPEGNEIIDSENDRVREWAEALIDRYRGHAERVDAETFA